MRGSLKRGGGGRSTSAMTLRPTHLHLTPNDHRPWRNVRWLIVSDERPERFCQRVLLDASAVYAVHRPTAEERPEVLVEVPEMAALRDEHAFQAFTKAIERAIAEVRRGSSGSEHMR